MNWNGTISNPTRPAVLVMLESLPFLIFNRCFNCGKLSHALFSS